MKHTSSNKIYKNRILVPVLLLSVLPLLFAACSPSGKTEADITPSPVSENRADTPTDVPSPSIQLSPVDIPVSEDQPDTGYLVSPYDTGQDFTEANGINLLQGLKPLIADGRGNVMAPYEGDIMELVSESNFFQHIDIIGDHQTRITYDMGRSVTIDKVLVCGFYYNKINYCFDQYQLYFSESPENLYEPEHLAADYDNSGNWNSGIERSGADQLFQFTEPQKGRYFGIKFVKPNPTDNLIRISRLAVYNEEYSRQRTWLSSNGTNLLTGLSTGFLLDDGSHAAFLKGEETMLTDGIVFDENSRVELQASGGELRAVYSLGQKTNIDRMVLAGTFGHQVTYEIYASDALSDLFADESLAAVNGDAITDTPVEGSDVHTLNFTDRISAGYVGIRYLTGEDSIVLEETALYTFDKKIHVDSSRIINPDFSSYGVNVIPTALMKESFGAGYRDAYFDVEAARINTVKPKLARMWFQVDWMETDKGGYDFESPKMQSVYRYLDAFQAAGTEIELNFGWKVGSSITGWFSLPGVDPSNSAPADLDHYAASSSALLEELIVKRGYTNIKYLSAYNEPNFENEFMAPGNRKAYYAEMMEKIHQQLKAAKLRDKIQLWGPEESDHPDWTAYMAEQAGEVFDSYSFHLYSASVQGLTQRIHQRLAAIGSAPLYLTEFGFRSSEENWEAGNTAYAITAANEGLSGAMFWCMAGVTLTDPGSFTLADGDRHLWGAPQQGLGNVYYNFYEYGLLMRYVQGHSKVLSVSSPEEGIRSAAFLAPDGNYTVVVQAAPSATERFLNIEFDTPIRKTFQKYVYTREIQGDGNAVLPSSSASIKADRTLNDRIGSGYTTIVYTTAPAQPQVITEEVRVEVESGSSIQLHARITDEEDSLIWSVVNGSGSITKDGLYTAETGLRRYTAIPIKAASKADPSIYGIIVIIIN